MSEYLYAFASLGFLFWIARNAFFWGNLLQRNNFSFHRTRDFLTKSSPGRSILFSPFSLFKWLAILIYPVIIFHEGIAVYYHAVICGMYILEIVVVLREIIEGNFFSRRHISLKTFIIITFTIAFGVILFLLPPLDKFLWLVLVDRFIVFSIFLFVMVPALPEELYWEYKSYAAVQKLRTNKKLTVIVLFGGAEFTVIKNLINSILAQKAEVLAIPSTPDKQHLIKTIQTKLRPSHAYLIIHTSDSTRNNIKEIVALLSPQYIALDQREISAESDYVFLSNEVLPLLHNKSEVFVFGKSPNILKNSKRIHKRIHFISHAIYPVNTSEIYITDITVGKKHTVVTITASGKVMRVRTALITEMAARYVVTAFTLLTAIGIPLSVIRTGIIESDEHFGYRQYSVKNNIVLINSSQENAPEEIPSFVPYLQFYKKKRILVWDTGITIEKTTGKKYIQTTSEISGQFDYIFLTGSSELKAIKKGLKGSAKESYVVVASVKKIVSYLRSIATGGDIIIFFGSESAEVFRSFRENSK